MSIYQGYDLGDLEVQYDIAGTIESLEVYHAEYGGLSAKVVERLGGKLDISFGDDPLQSLDAFPAANPGAPILMFIHGGYWVAGDKAGYRFPADTFHDAGAVWTPINYRLAPAVSLDDIVHDVRSAVAWVYNHATEIGGDASQLYVFGHSAGGHLTAMTLASGWQNDYGLPDDVEIAAGMDPDNNDSRIVNAVYNYFFEKDGSVAKDIVPATPHTYNWYYQPEWGWLWTNEENFPFVYKAGSAETAGTWLYFSQLPDQPAASFYDYSLKQWVTIGE